jgi:hypothetical protein
MTVLRGFLIVGVSTLVCGLIGTGVGYLLGVHAPGYYRTVFRSGLTPQFDPVEMGIGLGLTQGLVAGLVVGCVIVLAVAWYNSRRQIVIQEFPSFRASPPADAKSSAIQAAAPE